MRIVAPQAGLARVVSVGQNLWKSRRAGHIIAVTEDTEIPAFGFGRLNIIRVFDMLRRRTVTDLARQPLMERCLFGGVNVIVTIDTGLVSGIGNGESADFIGRFGPIMTVQAEGIRDQQVSDHAQPDDSRGKKDGKGNDLLWNPEAFHLHYLVARFQ